MTPSAAPAIDPANPWPGLAAYDEAAQEYFSGRAAEAAELARRIADEPVTVLFGKSGLGKSSLLRAGVFPLLRTRALLPVAVRLRHAADAPPPLEQVAQAMFAAFAAEGIEHPPPRAGESLWEYLHRDGLRFWTPKVRPVRPAFVLDQFEEVYTLGRSARARSDALREELADLAENRIPAALAERLGAPPAADAGGTDASRPSGADADRPRGLDVHAMPYKIVLSLREDFLPDLEGWVRAMPSLRRNRMRLLPMGRAQALQAVCNPRTQHLVDDPLASSIVAYLASGAGGAEPTGAAAGDPATADEQAERSVEPALLSLVCRGINEARKREGKARFDAALFEAGKGRIVADFYRESLADQPPQVRRFIEDELVTDQGFRNSYAVAAALGRGALTRGQVGALVDRRLLRIEHHLGTERIELTHDLLTRAVLEGRNARMAAERAAALRRWVLRAAAVGVVVIGLVAGFAWLQVQKLRADEDVARTRADAAAQAASAAEARARADRSAKEDIEKAFQQIYVEQLKAQQASQDAMQASERADEQRKLADTQRKLAEAAQRVARSRELAARARGRLGVDREQAVLLAAEALGVADTPEARAVLIDAARYAWPRALLDAKQLGGRAKLVAIDHGGTRLAVLTENGVVNLFDLGRRTPALLWSLSLPDGPVGMTFAADARHLYLGRPGAVDRLDTANPKSVLRLPLPPRDGGPDSAAQLVASADGRWLGAATGSGRLLLRRLDGAADDPAAWQTVASENVTHFAMSADAQRIATVTSSPLGGAVLERDGAGQWKPLAVPVQECVELQSITPAATYLVATWKAQSCTFGLARGRATRAAQKERAPKEREVQAEAIVDSLASPQGDAFVAVLDGGDLHVGLGSPVRLGPTSRIKAANVESPGSMAELFALDDLATRLAWIDEDQGGVRVYTLGSARLLLTEHPEETLAVSPDGRWVVQAVPAGRGHELRITMLDAVLGGVELATPRARIPIAGLPKLLRATRDAVIVGTESGSLARSTSVHDAMSGARRAGPLAGSVLPLGLGHELLVVPAPRGSGAADRIVRTRDGAESPAPWPPAADRQQQVRLTRSAASTALLAAHRSPPGGSTFVAEAFRIDGERIERTGRLVDLPSGELPEIADDGRSVVLRGKRIALDPKNETGMRRALADFGTTDAQPRLGGKRVVARSPSGRHAVVLYDEPARAIVTDSAGRPIGGLGTPADSGGGWRFSADDRWLTYQDGKQLRVIDLQSAREAVAVDDLLASPDRSALAYVADGRLLLVKDADGNQMLVPLDPQLARRFAKWLVPRALDRDERCTLGVDQGAACAAVAPPKAGAPARR